MSSRAPKRRRLTPPQSEDEGNHTQSRSSKKIQKAFFKSASSWDLEQDYENRKRKGSKKDKKESNRLPIKTADGRIEQLRALEDDNDDAESVESDGDWLDGREDEDATAEAAAERMRQNRKEEEEKESDLPEHVQVQQAQEELAKIATALQEDPEENVGAFKSLAKIGQSRLVKVQIYTLLTQLEVYKDVIPGYRIRPVSEDAPGEKLSKEVRKLRAFEQALVSGYQGYVKELARLAKINVPATRRSGPSISSVAIGCACKLINSVPHFNFRGDLLKILVGRLSKRRVDADFRKCCDALAKLFVEDEEGRPAMEAVSLLSKMMKAREYNVDESVPNLFLHLRLLDEFAGTASQDRVDRKTDPGVPPPQSRKSHKKEFRTKKERKQLKEQRAIQKDMQLADALVSHEERDRMQSETLKLVFATYFRILKQRVPHLMGAVLEGLAKYAHLINQDFFGDLLEALKDLIRHAQEDAEGNSEPAPDADGNAEAPAQEDDDDDGPVRNTSREALLCTVTAFALLAGQDAHNARSTLHLDLSHFITHLFTSLPTLSLNPDLELTSKSRPAGASTRDNRVNYQTTTVLLVHCLKAVLLPPYQIRSVPPLRLAAFSKQLMSAALHVPDKSAQAALALLQDVARTHGKKIAALWRTEERKGDGTYNALSDSVEGSNPFATTVWEGELLRRHFSPKVREGVKLLEKSIGNA